MADTLAREEIRIEVLGESCVSRDALLGEIRKRDPRVRVGSDPSARVFRFRFEGEAGEASATLVTSGPEGTSPARKITGPSCASLREASVS